MRYEELSNGVHPMRYEELSNGVHPMRYEELSNGVKASFGFVCSEMLKLGTKKELNTY
jgi:hypothetical protein